jgi:hypothetical protein
LDPGLEKLSVLIAKNLKTTLMEVNFDFTFFFTIKTDGRSVLINLKKAITNSTATPVLKENNSEEQMKRERGCHLFAILRYSIMNCERF